MKKKANSAQQTTLDSRVDDLEFNVAKISETLYGLIAMFHEIPDPPCPPMCNPVAAMAKETTKSARSKKSAGSVRRS